VHNRRKTFWRRAKPVLNSLFTWPLIFFDGSGTLFAFRKRHRIRRLFLPAFLPFTVHRSCFLPRQSPFSSMKITLEPGEYALMLGTQNLSIFLFALAPPAAHPNGTN